MDRQTKKVIYRAGVQWLKKLKGKGESLETFFKYINNTFVA